MFRACELKDQTYKKTRTLHFSDLLRAMGFLVSQHGEVGAIPPPPFLSVSPLESIRSGGAIPPPTKEVSQRYLRDTL